MNNNTQREEISQHLHNSGEEFPEFLFSSFISWLWDEGKPNQELFNDHSNQNLARGSGKQAALVSSRFWRKPSLFFHFLLAALTQDQPWWCSCSLLVQQVQVHKTQEKPLPVHREVRERTPGYAMCVGEGIYIISLSLLSLPCF